MNNSLYDFDNMTQSVNNIADAMRNQQVRRELDQNQMSTQFPCEGSDEIRRENNRLGVLDERKEEDDEDDDHVRIGEASRIVNEAEQ